MSILIALLATVGAAVIVTVAAFFLLMFVFERTFDSGEGLGIVWLAGVGSAVAGLVALVGTFVIVL